MGAWIETIISFNLGSEVVVAPYVGAWIETPIVPQPWLVRAVAPYVGAWIETTSSASLRSSARSHPTWVRGLKQVLQHPPGSRLWSHPTWVRGLKHGYNKRRSYKINVAPYVGAWIETHYR